MHPIAYSARYEADDRNRLTIFFRWIVVIPWMFVAFFYALGALIAGFVAWFALLFTGSYPPALYDFNAGFLRFSARVNGFAYLLTDEFPPFGGGEEPGYPIRLLVGPAKPEYSRLKVLFRIILLIPVYILTYVMSTILSIVAVIAWVVTLITGRLPEGLYRPIRIASAYSVKALAYYLLMTEDFPPFWQDESEEAPRFLGGGDGAATADLSSQTAGPLGLS